MENVSVGKGQTLVWLSAFWLVLIWSAISPYDYLTWFLEVVPALIGIALLAATFHRYPLTKVAYWLILFHSLVLMVGGHYTYAEVPLFDLIREAFDQNRNNYDKVGHFMQGFVPVILAREILIRNQVVNGARWTQFLAVCFTLAFSAFYELIEWWVALLSEEASDSFLGTQGYVWDTQSDMLWALSGAIISLVTLSVVHNRQIQEVTAKSV